jgi:hypothetical protein
MISLRNFAFHASTPWHRPRTPIAARSMNVPTSNEPSWMSTALTRYRPGSMPAGTWMEKLSVCEAPDARVSPKAVVGCVNLGKRASTICRKSPRSLTGFRGPTNMWTHREDRETGSGLVTPAL